MTVTSPPPRRGFTRREILSSGAVVACGTAAALLLPRRANAAISALLQAQADGLAQRKAALAALPITTTPLPGGLKLLAGPGGNVILSTGPDGLLLVDNFVAPAWPKFKAMLDAEAKSPVKVAINTHWHFDHNDNNANLRGSGAAIVAHANTATRMAESHEILGMHIPPSAAEARPTQTFADRHRLDVNGDAIELSYIPPAHTDTDIAVRFSSANVLHLGDLYFAGSYPFIDTTTGGNINGMVAAAESGLSLADASTKIVPGHGPLSDRAGLTQYRDMLATVRDRVRALKSAGRSLEETIAAKPTAPFDAAWAAGRPASAVSFVTLVYSTL